MPLLPKFSPRSAVQRKATLEQAMLRREAAIGGALFGPLAKGHARQFFCLDKHTWIWHETWKDKQNQQNAVTTRYVVRPNGVIKSQNGKAYQAVTLDEARNLYRAVELYQQRVDADYQQMLQYSFVNRRSRGII